MKIKKIEVCHGPTCGINGGRRIKKQLEEYFLKDTIEIVERECCGRCSYCNTIVVDGELVSELKPETLEETFLKNPEGAIKTSQEAFKKRMEKLDDILSSPDTLLS